MFRPVVSTGNYPRPPAWVSVRVSENVAKIGQPMPLGRRSRAQSSIDLHLADGSKREQLARIGFGCYEKKAASCAAPLDSEPVDPRLLMWAAKFGSGGSLTFGLSKSVRLCVSVR